ncbi:MAG: MltA domain-containing protein [Parvibaculaceae bacterium]|nr:MltA domain-containing protein [Parvibaculaceae bacterium]
MRLRSLSGALCAAALLFASLSPLEAAPAYKVLGFGDLPGWTSDDQNDALNAFRRSCARIMKLAPDAPLDATTATSFYGAARDWQGPCTQAASVRSGAGSARAFFERWFLPVSFTGDKAGLFTGYYEPEYRGALKQGGVYQTPILSIPADYRPDAPYYTRTQIETGKVDAQRYAIVWLADPVDAFFLHVQGSGRIRLEGGRTLRVGFAAKNNRPYTAVGRVLLQQGALKPGEVSMQTIRAWLEAHPAQETALLRQNDSYVFFRVLTDVPSELGPLGSEGTHLTPGRSLAVDRRFHPMGSPVWLDASAVPVPFNDGVNKPMQRLVIAQDAGTAITGRQRGDVFWGAGPEAADIAGRMQSPGALVALVPRSALGKE